MPDSAFCQLPHVTAPAPLNTVVRRLHTAMVDLRPRLPPKKLKQILKIKDPGKFLSDLVDLAIPPGTNFDPPPEKRHELRQMIAMLRGFSTYAGGDGIWKWLIEEGQMDWFAKMKGCFKRVGAKRALAYFDKTAAAFPRGRIPKDDDKRADLLLESEKLDVRLRKLDRQYKDCFNEIAECLRDYIRRNFEMFRKELEDEENRVV